MKKAHQAVVRPAVCRPSPPVSCGPTPPVRVYVILGLEIWVWPAEQPVWWQILTGCGKALALALGLGLGGMAWYAASKLFWLASR